MNNPTFDMQTICMTPNDTVVDVTQKNWPILKEWDFYIINGQLNVMAVKILLKNDEWRNPLKKTNRYWRTFVMYSKDSNLLITISFFINQGNKVRQFEASWGANIVTKMFFWVEHKWPSKECKNIMINNIKWHVRYKWIYNCAFYLWLQCIFPLKFMTNYWLLFVSLADL